jgi:hypothetical protein
MSDQRALSAPGRDGRRIDAVEDALVRARAALVRILRLRRLTDSAEAPRPWTKRGRRREERRIIASHRQRALERVLEAAEAACDDWAQGLDLDEAMRALQAELYTASEFETERT